MLVLKLRVWHRGEEEGFDPMCRLFLHDLLKASWGRTSVERMNVHLIVKPYLTVPRMLILQYLHEPLGSCLGIYRLRLVKVNLAFPLENKN